MISDESSIYDFTGLDEMELPDIHKKIQEMYNIDVSDIKSRNLLKIFRKITDKVKDHADRILRTSGSTGSPINPAPGEPRRCRNCGSEVLITAGTIFERTQMSLRTWFVTM